MSCIGLALLCSVRCLPPPNVDFVPGKNDKYRRLKRFVVSKSSLLKARGELTSYQGLKTRDQEGKTKQAIVRREQRLKDQEEWAQDHVAKPPDAAKQEKSDKKTKSSKVKDLK